MKVKRLFVFLLLFGLLSCGKENLSNLTLPTETQSGEFTFGCKLNDEIYIPRGAIFTTPAYRLIQYKTSTGQLAISTTCSDKSQSFGFYVSGVYQPGNYPIPGQAGEQYRFSDQNATCQLYDAPNTIQSGTVTITRLDTIAKIVSGRFSGLLQQTGCPDIKITEGRFDLKMDVYN